MTYSDELEQKALELISELARTRAERDALLADVDRLTAERDAAEAKVNVLRQECTIWRDLWGETDDRLTTLAAELAQVKAQLEHGHTGPFAPLDEMYKRGELTHEQYVNGLHLLYGK